MRRKGNMKTKKDITKNLNTGFSRKDFKCKCGKCRHEVVDIEGLQILTETSAAFGACNLRSANRCTTHNRAEGGHINSYHLYGLAWDVSFLLGAPEKWQNFILNRFNSINLDIVLYSDYIHIEIDNSGVIS